MAQEVKQQRRWFVVAGIFTSLTISVAIAAILLPRLLNLENYRPQILSIARIALLRPVAYHSAEFAWRPYPTIIFNGITISEKNSARDLLTIDRLSFNLALLPLLKREVHLRGVVVDRPVLLLSRDRQGLLNISDLFSGAPSAYQLQLASISVRNGLLRFTDHQIDAKGFTTVMEKLELQLENLNRGETAALKLSAMIPESSGDAAVSIAGKMHLPKAAEPLTAAQLDLSLSAEKFDPWYFRPYFGDKLPIKSGSGSLTGTMKLKGGMDSFTARGEFRTSGFKISYPAAFRKTLTPNTLQLDFDFERTPHDLLLKSFTLDINGLQAKGSCSLTGFREKDPHISASVTTGPLRFDELNSYIPYGIIPKGTSNFIAQHIKGGIFRLEKGKLEGKLSQIMNLGSGDNSNVLDLHVKVKGGQLAFGPQVPALNAISGTLLLRSRDFVLQDLAGRFGSSPFTLNGSIAGYSLAAPATYPFTMNIVPAAPEIAWLLRQQPDSLVFSGRSLLRLSGSGTAADYRLAGEWDLSGADYRYQQALHKPAGMANRLQFTARLGENQAQVSDLRYELFPLTITASATYRYQGEEPLVFNAASNRFQAGQVLSVLPALLQYQPAGMLQAGISGSGDPAKPESIRLQGTINLEDFSIKPLAQFKALHGISGAIKLTETTLEADKLTGSIGDSALRINGEVAGRTNPTVSLSFSTPQLHLEDFGMQSAAPVPVLKNFAGTISLKDGNLTVKSLTGELNRSRFSASGALTNGVTPQISALVDFPYLLVEDVQTLAGLHLPGNSAEKLPGLALQARVTAAAGSALGVPFKGLDTSFSWLENRLNLQSLRTSLFDGNVAGSGQVDFSSANRPHYQINYQLEKIAAGQLLQAAGYKPLLRGQLTAEGECSLRGSDREGLLKSVSATARLQLQDGLIAAQSTAKGETGADIPLGIVTADLDLQGRNLTVKELKASALGGSIIASGQADFNSPGRPQYQARYNLDRVAADQLLLLAGYRPLLEGVLTAAGDVAAAGNNSSELLASARASADLFLTDGKLRLSGISGNGTAGLPFQKVHSRFDYAGRVLKISSVAVEALGGSAAIEGAIDLNQADGPAYRSSFNIVGMDAAAIFHEFDLSREVSGKLTLKGELSGRGADQPALLKTLQGPVTAHLEKGVIKRYGFISKIFSVLNVSQLLDFRLPDFVSTGMPYDTIDGSYVFADGKVTTSDLLLHSPSLNMTLVGSADLINKELDLKAGVQPFQTVGRVISKIPIFGWLLTGSKKRLVVVYMTAKGGWDNPEVTITPMTSLESKVIGIFKRTLNLPGELFAEPGKVILGQ